VPYGLLERFTNFSNDKDKTHATARNNTHFSVWEAVDVIEFQKKVAFKAKEAYSITIVLETI
jgi:hypothetical protein